MPIDTSSAASAAQAVSASAAMWEGVAYGALASAIIAVGLFMVDKIFGDYWYGLSFYRPKHKQKLAGTGIAVYGIVGKSKTGQVEKVEDLSAKFPSPGDTDGVKYVITNVDLRTKRNHDAFLTCDLTWTAKHDEWNGKLVGRGRFFPKGDGESFVGYVYLVCDATATSGTAKETWKVTYILGTNNTYDGWDGYWVMIDSYDAGKAKFGRLDLKYK